MMAQGQETARTVSHMETELQDIQDWLRNCTFDLETYASTYRPRRKSNALSLIDVR